MRKIVKNLLIYAFGLLSILFFNGCLNEEKEKIDEEFKVPIIKPDGSEQYLNSNSDFIFDQNELRTFELKLSEKDLEKIDSNPTAEQYVEGMMVFEGDTISPIGIRYKGLSLIHI